MPKITKRTVDTLEATSGRPSFLWDDALTGFGVKALPTGGKRYFIKYRAGGGGRGAQQRWFTLGSHGQITANEARSMAQQALAAIARGSDPQQEKLERRTAATLTDLWERFTAEHLPQRKPTTRYEYALQWRQTLAPKLGKAPVAGITRSQVDRLHKSLSSTPYRANRVIALLSRLMTLAEMWELRPQGTNPCLHVTRFRESPRERYLSAEELQRLGESMEAMVTGREINSSAVHAIQLLLMTGARLNEILRAEWSWVDQERRVLALPDSKTGKKPVFLGDASLIVLERQRVFSGGSRFIFPAARGEGPMINLRKSWQRICDRAGLPDVRLHDLRHTAASIAVGQGASLPIIGRLLGHSQAQTTQRYAHVSADPALSAANALGAAVAQQLASKRAGAPPFN